MSLKTFRVSGKFKRNRKTQDFTKELRGLKKEDVLEVLISTIGSQHHVKRFQISIENVEEINE
jgi:ribosomal protein L20A (L18A)